jgi:hypothetical protein
MNQIFSYTSVLKHLKTVVNHAFILWKLVRPLDHASTNLDHQVFSANHPKINSSIIIIEEKILYTTHMESPI